MLKVSTSDVAILFSLFLSASSLLLFVHPVIHSFEIKIVILFVCTRVSYKENNRKWANEW